MKLKQKYFCYGAVLTTLFWVGSFYLYSTINNPPRQGYNGGDGNIYGNKQPNDVKLRAKNYYKKLERKESWRDVNGNSLDNGNEGNAIEPGSPGEIWTKHGPNAWKLLPDLNQLAIIKTPEDQQRRDQGYRHYAFNILISDNLGFHRGIPDTRHELCPSQVYPESLPSASVVICFYNEAWSALLRTIHSVVDRTPAHLVHEIILVDDQSSMPHLHETLSRYLEDNLPIVKLIRTGKRLGLIRARILGAERASGEVLVFLDSHCEVSTRWLEPLLTHVAGSHGNVAVPIIDIIDQDTMEYEPSPLVRGGFNWGLFFRWDQIPRNMLQTAADYVKPIKTPTMAGGLFAIDRLYFYNTGKYDPGLDTWGGENLEISFRVWQCGGSLHIIPCSRVGHIFRKRRPYGSIKGADSMTQNSLRVATVWMDEYKEYFLQTRADARHMTFGDVSARVTLRENLRCKSFKWYLENVYPEQTLPQEKGGGLLARDSFFQEKKHPKLLKKGFLYHKESGLCVVSHDNHYVKKSLLVLQSCSVIGESSQIWHQLDDYSLQLGGALCLDFEEPKLGRSYPRLMKCHFSGGSQEWKWSDNTVPILLNPASGKCLMVDSTSEGSFLSLEFCDKRDPKQYFKLTLMTR